MQLAKKAIHKVFLLGGVSSIPQYVRTLKDSFASSTEMLVLPESRLVLNGACAQAQRLSLDASSPSSSSSSTTTPTHSSQNNNSAPLPASLLSVPLCYLVGTSVISRAVEKGEVLPALKEKKFVAPEGNGAVMSVKIVEGDDPKNLKLIGTFSFEMPMHSGDTLSVPIVLHVDANGLLTLTAVIKNAKYAMQPQLSAP